MYYIEPVDCRGAVEHSHTKGTPVQLANRRQGEFFKTASAADWSACKLSAGATTIEIHGVHAAEGRVVCAEHGTRIRARAAAAT